MHALPMIADPPPTRRLPSWLKRPLPVGNENFFTQVIRNESIRAEGKWQFDVTWNRKDNDEKPVPAGAYRLTAIVTSSPLLQVSIPLNIP